MMTSLVELSLGGMLMLFGQEPAQVRNPAPTGRPIVASSIEGTVIDVTTRAPVQDVAVDAAGPSRATARTDSSGRYRLRELRPGSYALVTKAQSYGKTPLGTTSLPRRVRLGNGEQLKGIDFEVAREAVMSGRVVNSGKQPLVGARVVVLARCFQDGAPMFSVFATTTSDDLGGFRVAGLGEGAYYVAVSPTLLPVKAGRAKSRKVPLQAEVAVFYPGVDSMEAAAPLYLRAGERREGIELRLQRAETHCVTGSIEGLLTREQVGIRLVRSWPRWSSVVSLGAIRNSSLFEICGLPAGEYYFDGFTFEEPQGISGLAHVEFLLVNEDLDIGKLSLSPGLVISGAVTVLDAGPHDALPSGLSITLRPKGRVPWKNEPTAGAVTQRGEFTISGVLPYECWLRVQGLPTGYYLKGATIGGRDAIREPIRAGYGEATLVLGADGASVSGQVGDEDGKSVAGSMVVLAPFPLPARGAPGLVQTQQADQNGRFEFSTVAPAEYRVLAFTGLGVGEGEDVDFLRGHVTKAVDLTVQARQAKALTLTVLAAH